MCYETVNRCLHLVQGDSRLGYQMSWVPFAAFRLIGALEDCKPTVVVHSYSILCIGSAFRKLMANGSTWRRCCCCHERRSTSLPIVVFLLFPTRNEIKGRGGREEWGVGVF